MWRVLGSYTLFLFHNISTTCNRINMIALLVTHTHKHKHTYNRYYKTTYNIIAWWIWGQTVCLVLMWSTDQALAYMKAKLLAWSSNLVIIDKLNLTITLMLAERTYVQWRKLYTKKDRERDYQAPPNLYKLIVHKRKHLSDSIMCVCGTCGWVCDNNIP